jgi:tetratricopeptide (TPR) repeat protein
VKAWNEDVYITTYLPDAPDKNPMFLEKRVYQGSSGRVYPLPFIDRIASEPRKKRWKAIHIENDYVRLMILPEIGGRIHIGYDKIAGYDFFYRQNVIKPALVGLAGPWISGGVEFNWPQHHRPATFMPVETEIEKGSDGSITIWCSDHDPMLRMKGMHGICLYPDRALVELKVRLFNRTQFTQTFLWWANVATRVHEKYQSFFPPDIRFVADHAKRAVTSFPLSDQPYYGVDYPGRAQSGVPEDETPRMFVPDGSYARNDLGWYANIPVPTSYMVASTEGNFFGGYDHKADAGVVHVANHHISPGKKQWTWGNHEFGYAWDRNLTDSDGPYIELMAGVYTDNQPDFSYLAPWETKTFSQYWFPIHKIGVPLAANRYAGLSLRKAGTTVQIGIAVTQAVKDATITLRSGKVEIGHWTYNIEISEPLVITAQNGLDAAVEELSVVVTAGGKTLIEYDGENIKPAKQPVVAKEPAPPEQIPSVEELYLTGVHLCQYRHATRQPEMYWREALRRDAGDARTHNAMGVWCLRRGEFALAAEHFEAAIARLTRLNPNPYDGEAYYNLGVTRRYQRKEKEAYSAFYKATWNAAWRGPAYFALAEIDAKNRRWEQALDHVRRSLKAEPENLNACNLHAAVLGRIGDHRAAEQLYAETLAIDPLDVGVRWHSGIAPANGQERLDLAFDFLRAGFDEEAATVLRTADLEARDGSVPMILLTLEQVEADLGSSEAVETYLRAKQAPLEYCFPARLEEMLVLESTIARHPQDGAASYLLGNLLYDRRRHDEAIAAWEHAAFSNPSHATLWRNLGIAYFNIRKDATRALEAFERAHKADPQDGRILYERDQLWKRTGTAPERRLEELLHFPAIVLLRDDLSVELATLYNQVGRPEDALELMLHRKFQPWEGGEGLTLAQYVRAHLLLGQRALGSGNGAAALVQFQSALQVPGNLGEARHLLAGHSDIDYWLGVAHESLREETKAAEWWHRATRQTRDSQPGISEMSYWSALAHRRLGEEAEAVALFRAVLDYSGELEASEPNIPYFATSLPAMLLFEEDLRRRKTIEARYLRAQAMAGMGRTSEAADLLDELLTMDRNHAGAADLLRRLNPSGGKATGDSTRESRPLP